MRAILLVGGEGTRLRPLTFDMPKQLLPIAGATMLERAIEPLARGGVQEVVLSLGYRPDAFICAFPDGTACGVPLSYAVEPTLLGTGGAVRFAAQEAGITDEPMVVRNGDVISDIDLAAMHLFHKKTGAAATIALTAVEDPSSFGVVVADEDGRVESFVEKPPRGSAPTNLVNAGTYILEPEVIDRIPSGRSVSIEREIFPMLSSEGSLFAMHCDGYWLDAGTPEKYLRANRDVLMRRDGRSPFEGAAPLGEPDDGVWSLGALDASELQMSSVFLHEAVVGAGAQILESAVGRGAVIGKAARVVRSVVLEGATIGAGAVVEDSIVGRTASVGDFARVTNWSVIGTGATVEGGAILSGARLPE